MVLSDFEVWRVLWRRQSTTSRSSSSRSSISSSSNKLSSIGTPLTRAASTSPSGESAPPQASSRPFSSALLVSGVWGVNKWKTKKSTFYQTNNVWVPEGGGGGKGREGGPEKDCFPMQSLMFPQPEQSHHQLRTSRYMGENDFRDEALVTGAGEEQQVFLHFYFTKQKCVNREREKTKASCVFKEEQSSFAN